jgi:hypothetical protein
MERPELLLKVERLVDQAIREGMWGSIEIEFRQGRATLIRTHKTEPLDDSTMGGPRANRPR